MNKRPVERRPIGLGRESIRERLATTHPDNRSDIGHIWREQDRLSKERWKLESQKPSFIEVARTWIANFLTHLPKIKYLYALKFSKLTARKLKNYKSVKVAGLVAVAIMIAVGFSLITNKSEQQGNQTASLGAQTGSESNDDRRTDENPDFEVLYPKDNSSLTTVTRRAPSGDLIHTFRDTLEDIEVEVTQQKVPDSFNGNEFKELEKLAKNFLAENVIQVDSTIIYHGKDEKTNVQSLFLIKEGVLISIRSAQPVADDVWAAYVLNLQ